MPPVASPMSVPTFLLGGLTLCLSLCLSLCLPLSAARAQVPAPMQVQAQEPLVNFNVVLLQPSSVLEARVPQVDAMADYVRAVEAAAREAVRDSDVRQAVGGFIVVAVRPGGRSNAWLDFDTLLDLTLRRQLVARIRAVPPFEAVKGPVVFALRVATWGGKASKRLAPSPPEWRDAAASGARLEVGELVERIWVE